MASNPTTNRVPALDVTGAGAHNGADGTLPVYVEAARAAPYRPVRLHVVDPVAGRAAAFAARATRAGIVATAEEARIEDTDLAAADQRSPIVMHTDNYGSYGAVIARILDRPRPFLGYMFGRFSDGVLLAVATVISPDDEEGYSLLGRTAAHLQACTARSNRDRFWGGEFAPQASGVQAAVRGMFNAHLNDVLDELEAGITPQRPRVEVSVNGGPLEPGVVIDRSLKWGTADQLARTVADRHADLAQLGRGLGVLELGPNRGFRLHNLGVRRTGEAIDHRSSHGTGLSVQPSTPTTAIVAAEQGANDLDIAAAFGSAPVYAAGLGSYILLTD